MPGFVRRFVLRNEYAYTERAERYGGCPVDPEIWYLMAINAERSDLPDPTFPAYRYSDENQYLMTEGDALNQQDLEMSFGVILEHLAAEFAENDLYARAFELERARSRIVHMDIFNA